MGLLRALLFLRWPLRRRLRHRWKFLTAPREASSNSNEKTRRKFP
jgi:hypothetical protein